MIEFLKIILKKVNFKSENEELNKYNKIVYSLIILCAVAFLITIIVIVIKAWPNIIDYFNYYWNENKSMLNLNNFK